MLSKRFSFLGIGRDNLVIKRETCDWDVRFSPVLLKTEKDFCHRKGPKRTFGHRKGLRYGMFRYKNLCSRTSNIIMILIST